MSKNYNYNYVFVMYDVEQKRCHKVFKVCKKYLNHFQLSVFRGKITPSLLIRLKSDLNKVICKDVDHVVIIKLLNSHYFDEEIMGKKHIDFDDDFFI